jgi:predicted permease
MQGILDQAGRRTLSKLIYCLFTPALTFTKLAPVLSGQHLVLWMPLVINMFVRWAWALAVVITSSVGIAAWHCRNVVCRGRALLACC